MLAWIQRYRPIPWVGKNPSMESLSPKTPKVLSFLIGVYTGDIIQLYIGVCSNRLATAHSRTGVRAGPRGRVLAKA